MTLFRRWWGKSYVEITRRVGEDEVVKVSFNENDPIETVQRLDHILTYLKGRADDHNRTVLELLKKKG